MEFFFLCYLHNWKLRVKQKFKGRDKRMIPDYRVSDRFYPPFSPFTVVARSACSRIGLVEGTLASRGCHHHRAGSSPMTVASPGLDANVLPLTSPFSYKRADLATTMDQGKEYKSCHKSRNSQVQCVHHSPSR